MDQTYTLQELGIGPNRPAFPYDIDAVVNSLPVYDTCEGSDSQLDLSREVLLSNNYVYQGVGFPEIPQGQLTTIDAYATISGTIAIPSFTYLVALTHYTNQPEGFKIRIYDKGAQTELFYNKFAKDITASSPMGVADPMPTTVSTQQQEINSAQGPRFITSPMISLPPGTLQIEITNLSPNANLVQVLFNFAIPLGNKAMNVVSIISGDGN